MYNFEEIKQELRKVITPDTVFVCIGSSRFKFDTFGPLCGTMLKKKGVPYYGDMRKPVNGVNMYQRLYEIYDIDQHLNENIIAIDACVTSYNDKLNKIDFRPFSGIEPAKGVGGQFPTIGEKSIVMYTLTKDQLNRMLRYSLKDLSNRQLIKRQANLITNVIAEIYHDVCNNTEVKCNG